MMLSVAACLGVSERVCGKWWPPWLTLQAAVTTILNENEVLRDQPGPAALQGATLGWRAPKLCQKRLSRHPTGVLGEQFDQAIKFGLGRDCRHRLRSMTPNSVYLSRNGDFATVGQVIRAGGCADASCCTNTAPSPSGPTLRRGDWGQVLSLNPIPALISQAKKASN